MAEIFYCDVADVERAVGGLAKLIKLTDGTDAVNVEVLDGHRRDAMSDVNGYCMRRYGSRIPFNPVPDAVRKTTTILTKYYLYHAKGRVDDKTQKQYDQVILQLRDISSGRFKLEQENVEVPGPGIKFTNKKPEDRAFYNPTGYFE